MSDQSCDKGMKEELAAAVECIEIRRVYDEN